MGTELAEWTRKVSQCNFLQHGISLTTAQARRESDLEILLQSMLLTDAKDSNYNYKAISMREVMKYCKEIRGNYADSRREEITSTLDYLSEAFTEKHKFLKKSNVPMVFIMGNLAMQKDIKPSDFKPFVDSFAGSECVDYEVNTGSGNIKRVKTEGRLVAMFKSFKDYFELPDEEGFTPIGSNKDAA